MLFRLEYGILTVLYICFSYYLFCSTQLKPLLGLYFTSVRTGFFSVNTFCFYAVLPAQSNIIFNDLEILNFLSSSKYFEDHAHIQRWHMIWSKHHYAKYFENLAREKIGRMTRGDEIIIIYNDKIFWSYKKKWGHKWLSFH